MKTHFLNFHTILTRLLARGIKELNASVLLGLVCVIMAHPLQAQDSTSLDVPSVAMATSPSNKGNNKTAEKLIAKADSYFDKMWYAEAAELYEQALEGNPQEQRFDVLQKAADANYFNSNMQRAYHWYDVMYDKYEDQLSNEDLFKYAHSLKGVGKYGRAKKLMRLYDEKMGAATSEDQSLRSREMELDNLLTSTARMEIKDLNINSEYSDFAPMFYENDKLIFASARDSAFLSTRTYKWNDEPFLDLYVSNINKSSMDLGAAEKFSNALNSKYHEATVSFSPDRNTIYFTRNSTDRKHKRESEGVNYLKIFRSQKVDGEWSEPELLPFNSNAFSTGHPALSPDGKKLYFVSNRPGTLGETDVFVVDVNEDGSFSEPKNLGPKINTPYREMFPYVTEDNLYFSSEGHVGLGGLDIYKVAILPNGGYGEVQNLGMPVNGSKDDFSYIIDEDTHSGFFASNREGGHGKDDLYSFKMAMPEEQNLNAIAGVVVDAVSGDHLSMATVALMDDQDNNLMQVQTDASGHFEFIDLDPNSTYTVKVSSEHYGENIVYTETADNKRMTIEVPLYKLSGEEENTIVEKDGVRMLRTDAIHFNFDDYSIRESAAEELDKMVTTLRANPSMVIRIESYTDSRGPSEYNQYLSQERANATKDYLLSQGVGSQQIQSAIGYGEDALLNGCADGVSCSASEHAQNRRSEFIIVKE